MSTFASRVTSDRKNLMLWCTIQGVGRVFKERPIAVSALVLGETRAESACIPSGGIDQGEETIDYEQLAQVGGGLKLRIQQPRGTTILEDIFRTQTRRVAHLTSSSLTKTATSFNVSSTTAFGAVNDTVTLYIGSETIVARIASATSFDTAVRGKYGSRAQEHKGTSSDGSAIYAVPPSMVGRRVSLYGSWVKDDGTTTAALTSLLATFSIDENPRWMDQTVEIQCGPAIDELMNRNCYVGLREVGSTGRMYYASSGDDLTIEVDDAGLLVPSANTDTFVLVKTDRRSFVGRVISTDRINIPNLVVVRKVPGLITRNTLNGGVDDGVLERQCKSVKPFAILSAGTGAILSKALVSRYGDLGGGINDVLPGLERTSAAVATEWRMGAGIDQLDIDSNTFASVTAPFWTYVLDDTVQVSELLKDFCLSAECFVVASPAGKLSMKPLSETRISATMTINAGVVARGVGVETFVDESAIAPLLTVRSNYSLLDGEFHYKETHVDRELVKRYSQRDAARVIELRGMAVDIPADYSVQSYLHPNLISQESMSQVGKRIQIGNGLGRLMAKVPCNLRAMAVSLGDVVTIDVDGKDYRGGSIRGRTGRVVGKRPQYDQGRCDLTLHVLEDVFVFAPTAVVTAVSTVSIANDTITVSTSDSANDDSTPVDNFPVGATIRLWDVSAGTSQTLTIAAINVGASTIRFTAGIVGAVETAVDWITWGTLGTTSQTSVSGISESALAFQMADSGVPASGAVRRWR